jgi:hypothetical protein
VKHIGITMCVLAALLAFGAVEVSSAVADPVLCLETSEFQGGNFATNACNTALEKKGSFVRGMLLENARVNAGEYCLMVLPGLRKFAKGYRSFRECEKEENLVEEPAAEPGPVLWTRVKDPAAGNKGGSKKPEFATLPSSKVIEGVIGADLFKVGSSGESVECENGTHGGEITSMNTVGKVVVKFKNCKAKGSGGTTCTAKSTGAGSGEIITRTLKGTLGSVKSAEAVTEVGLLLEPESGTVFTEIDSTCLSVSEVPIDGSIAGEVNPVSAKVSDGDIDYEVASAKQAIQKIGVPSGLKEPRLKALGLLETTDETVEEDEFEGTIEIV